jgi:hypothetical protein
VLFSFPPSLSSAPPRGSGGRCAGGRGGAEGSGAAAVSLAEELGGGETLFPGLFLCIGLPKTRGGPRDGGAPDLLRRRGELPDDGSPSCSSLWRAEMWVVARGAVRVISPAEEGGRRSRFPPFFPGRWTGFDSFRWDFWPENRVSVGFLSAWGCNLGSDCQPREGIRGRGGGGWF